MIFYIIPKIMKLICQFFQKKFLNYAVSTRSFF